VILVIDNFDSFTYNLVQLFGELGQRVEVRRNDQVTVAEAEALAPDYLLVSPGPGRPEQAGVSIALIRHFAGRIPVLGVCLGHQAIAAAFGGRIVKAQELMHGKSSSILHDGRTLFSGIPPAFSATRYHSLAVEHKNLPECLEISAATAEGEIMALRHKELALEGVQFHPESVATEHGRRILKNFLERTPRGPAVGMSQAIEKLVRRQDLTPAEMRDVMQQVMEGDATPAQVGALLAALRSKGETAAEIAAAAAVMREKATRIPVPAGVTLVDTCGTGGDGAHTFNISTVAALVAAGAGAVVAKHGNRAVSSRCGSADLLRELGVNIGIDSTQMGVCLKEAGIGFLFAPLLHQAMKHVVTPRREIGIRTLFNILGPLANPARAQAQLLGVFDRQMIPTMARVLESVGVHRALVVHGEDGLDEITLTGITYAAELENGQISETRIDPRELGFSCCTAEDLAGGSAEDNARIATEILTGRDRGPRRDIVVLNAGAAVYLGGRAATIAEGIVLAAAALDSGAAFEKLKALKEVSNAGQA
jgi:anthranilate synthase/phosphoribosyltransferase